MKSSSLKAVAAIAAALLAGTVCPAYAVDGLVTKESPHPVDATIERFEAAVKSQGFIVFTRLDHAAAAESAGLKMPRATVVVFGNPRLGTPVFIRTPTVAIDLPLKSMVWEDANGKVFLSYNTADYVNNTLYVRHGAAFQKEGTAKLEEVIGKMVDEALR